MKRRQIHWYIYLFSLFFLAAMIPVSNFGMSLGGILLSANWVAEWDWQNKWKRLKTNKLAFILAAFFFIFLIGFIHTDDWRTGADNLLSKLPLLYAPLIMASSEPPTGRGLRTILYGFIASTTIASIISIIYFCTNNVQDVREISLFISHIRFSFSIILSLLFALAFALQQNILPKWAKIGFFIVALWLITYLFVVQTFTAFILLMFITIAYIFYIICTKKKSNTRRAILITALLVTLGFCGHVSYLVWDYYHVETPATVTLSEFTNNGNCYEHDTTSIIENGSRIGMYVCRAELQAAWAMHSDSSFATVENTLIRYLNSKHLRKDKLGVEALTEQDIANIEKGIANVDYTRILGVKRALYPTLFSLSLYQKSGEIQFSSLLQRIELWKVSAAVFRENWLFGGGVGDHKYLIDKQLDAQHSKISQRNMGAHNQFLTFGVMGGIFVLIAFIVVIFAPLFCKKHLSFFYIAFFIIVFASFFTEDTLETQAGMTFFAFFNAFLLFCFDSEKIKFDNSGYLNHKNNLTDENSTNYHRIYGLRQSERASG